MSLTPNQNNTIVERIPLTRPLCGEEEEIAVLEVLRSGWLVQGPRVEEFEDQFKSFLGVKHAIATTSCTTALHLALLAAGVGPGDEVLLPSFTFIATANAVEYTGAKPVFVDIDLATYTVDPGKIEEYLETRRADSGSRPKCIIPVSLFGLCASMKAINEIAVKHGLKLIEDAACGLGAKRVDYYAGTEALAGCFSLHPRKAITTGEGGIIVTNDDRFAHAVRKMRNHGASTDLERHVNKAGSLLPNYEVLGYNYRMTDLQGAMGAAQMKKVDMILRGRQDGAARYYEMLQGMDKITTPFVPKECIHAYQSYVCLYKENVSKMQDINSIDWATIGIWNRERNYIMATLERNGISVRQGTHAVHTLSYYKEKYKLREHDYPMSFLADRLSIALPLYCGITKQEQRRVVASLKS